MDSKYFELWEGLILPAYLIVILGIGYAIAPKQERRLFMTSLSIRVVASIAFASIYLFYYGGGDTIAYYQTAKPFTVLFYEHPFLAIKALYSSYSLENYSIFSNETGFPLPYIYDDNQTFTVSRVVAHILLISFNSYLISSVILAGISFVGSWKLYLMFKDVFSNKRVAAISALFIPSVLFWGSGISKDTITLASASYLIYGVYFTFSKKEVKLSRIVGMAISLYFILSIKPYIFLALSPGVILWLLSEPISRLKSRFLRRFSIPIIAGISSILFFVLIQQLDGLLGSYATGEILEKAIVTQEDLKQDYYGGNSFDIGEVSPTIGGVLSKVPIATFYGLYAPTLLQIRNVEMLLSALENTFLIFLTLKLLATLKFRKIFTATLDNPILLFSILFSLLLAFSIGFTTPNYGAMIRFKIPLIPFFVFYLMSITQLIKKQKTS
jgi:hypothetical protein